MKLIATILAAALSCSTLLATEPVEPDTHPEAKCWANISTLAQLKECPGVGPVLATRIVETRSKLPHPEGKGFTDSRQLLQVKGIGPAKLAAIYRFVDMLDLFEQGDSTDGPAIFTADLPKPASN